VASAIPAGNSFNVSAINAAGFDVVFVCRESETLEQPLKRSKMDQAVLTLAGKYFPSPFPIRPSLLN
jgi:hypothetical protein